MLCFNTQFPRYYSLQDSIHMENINDAFRNIQFIINNDGFPLNEISFMRMIEFSKYLNSEDIEKIESILKKHVNQKKYPEVPRMLNSNVKLSVKIEAIQGYMNKLEYNFTGTQFFSIKTNRHLNGLMENAKEIINYSLPIKCLEAVILGIYLTNGISQLERFTIGFRSIFKGLVFKHVVLGLYSNGLYGAIGMSRREDLMYKPLHFNSLSDLIISFVKAYQQLDHNLVRISIGENISHDSCSLEPIYWKGLLIRLNGQSINHFREEIEKYSRKGAIRGSIQQNYLPFLPRCKLNSTAASRKPQALKDSTIIYFQRIRSGSQLKNRSKSTECIRV